MHRKREEARRAIVAMKKMVDISDGSYVLVGTAFRNIFRNIS